MRSNTMPLSPFAGPYAMLDGEDVLRAAGVELIWVSNEDLPGV